MVSSAMLGSFQDDDRARSEFFTRIKYSPEQ